MEGALSWQSRHLGFSLEAVCVILNHFSYLPLNFRIFKKWMSHWIISKVHACVQSLF